MFSLNDKISIRQFQILMILDIFGTGVLVLPRTSAEFAGQDGWIIILISTLLAVVCISIMSVLSAMFPEKSFFEYASVIVSKPGAYILSLGFIIRIILNIAFELRLFGEIVKETMLYNTPFWIICLIILLVGGFAAAKGIETRARIAELLIFIIIIPLIIVFAIACGDVDFTNVLPVLKNNPENYLKGGVFCLSAFTGIEMVMLSYPYIKHPKRAGRGGIVSVIVIGIFMCLITFITIARFGPDNVTKQMWPVLEMMDTIDLPGSFVERQEALIMSFWIVSIFAIVNAGLFFSSILLKSAVKKGKHIHYIVLTVLVVFVVSMLPDNMDQVYDVMDLMFKTFGIFYMAVMPLILLVIAKMRGLGDERG